MQTPKAWAGSPRRNPLDECTQRGVDREKRERKIEKERDNGGGGEGR